jgi:hypothetical protein
MAVRAAVQLKVLVARDRREGAGTCSALPGTDGRAQVHVVRRVGDEEDPIGASFPVHCPE